MTKYKVKVHPDELKKKNCMTCKYGEANTGTPCFEKHNQKWEECDEYFSGYEPAKENLC